MPKNPMGNDQNLTDKDFDQAASVMGQTPEEAMKNTKELLKKVTGEVPSKITKEGEFEKYEDLSR